MKRITRRMNNKRLIIEIVAEMAITNKKFDRLNLLQQFYILLEEEE